MFYLGIVFRSVRYGETAPLMIQSFNERENLEIKHDSLTRKSFSLSLCLPFFLPMRETRWGNFLCPSAKAFGMGVALNLVANVRL